MKFNAIDVIGQIADLKETDCNNTMAIAVLIELLIEKGLFSRQDFALKAQQLEDDTLTEALLLRRIGG